MKKIKWNWGTKLTIFIILFMILVLSFVYRSMQHPVMLVEKDYYPKGIEYQQRIDERNNAEIFKSQFQIIDSGNFILVKIPNVFIDSGNIDFFRPSNIKLDYNYHIIKEKKTEIILPDSIFKVGKYIVKFYWQSKEKKYYLEKQFYFKK